MKRTASAIWHGGLKDGKGMVSTESGVLKQTPYSFSTRFENQPGTNPEELIAAAHAGCFSMALSAELGKAGRTPETIRTSAALTMEKIDGGWTVTESHLDVTVQIRGRRQRCQSRLSHLTFAQRKDHHGRKAGKLARLGKSSRNGSPNLCSDSEARLTGAEIFGRVGISRTVLPLRKNNQVLLFSDIPALQRAGDR